VHTAYDTEKKTLSDECFYPERYLTIILYVTVTMPMLIIAMITIIIITKISQLDDVRRASLRQVIETAYPRAPLRS